MHIQKAKCLKCFEKRNARVFYLWCGGNRKNSTPKSQKLFSLTLRCITIKNSLKPFIFFSLFTPMYSSSILWFFPTPNGISRYTAKKKTDENETEHLHFLKRACHVRVEFGGVPSFSSISFVFFALPFRFHYSFFQGTNPHIDLHFAQRKKSLEKSVPSKTKL